MDKVCDCICCSTVLNLLPTGKLEIWYGTGSNGKTTLLNALASQLGHKHVVTISSERLKDISSKITATTKLVCVQEVFQDDEGEFVEQFNNISNLRPDVRFLMTTIASFPGWNNHEIVASQAFLTDLLLILNNNSVNSWNY